MNLKEALGHIYHTAKQKFGIKNAPQLYLRHDPKNAKSLFGKTAYYNPGNQIIVIFITNRHPKDICRSFAHELVHHHQNERGDLKGGNNSPTYAQDDPHMRKMEMEAYLKGNMLFRDFEDSIKY
jgi:hypothetical protein